MGNVSSRMDDKDLVHIGNKTRMFWFSQIQTRLLLDTYAIVQQIQSRGKTVTGDKTESIQNGEKKKSTFGSDGDPAKIKTKRGTI